MEAEAWKEMTARCKAILERGWSDCEAEKQGKRRKKRGKMKCMVEVGSGGGKLAEAIWLWRWRWRVEELQETLKQHEEDDRPGDDDEVLIHEAHSDRKSVV